MPIMSLIILRGKLNNKVTVIILQCDATDHHQENKTIINYLRKGMLLNIFHSLSLNM